MECAGADAGATRRARAKSGQGEVRDLAPGPTEVEGRRTPQVTMGSAQDLGLWEPESGEIASTCFTNMPTAGTFSRLDQQLRRGRTISRHLPVLPHGHPQLHLSALRTHMLHPLFFSVVNVLTVGRPVAACDAHGNARTCAATGLFCVHSFF